MRRVLEPGEVAVPLIEECGYSQECSACCNQDASLRYFDFDAAHDGGWYGGEEDGNRIAKDDLVLCEECVREPAEKLGWVEDDRIKELNLKLASQNETLKKELVKAEEYADRMADVLAHKGLKPDHRIKPRPARSGTGAPA